MSSARPRQLAFVLALVFFVISANSAATGGLFSFGFATPSIGLADAGSRAWPDNASTALHSPASMTQLENHAALAAAGVGIDQVEFDIDRAEIEGDSGGSYTNNRAIFLQTISATGFEDAQDA